MAQLSARAVKFIYADGKESTNVTFKVGNCKLTEKDLDTLILLKKCASENPANTIDCRKYEDKHGLNVAEQEVLKALVEEEAKNGYDFGFTEDVDLNKLIITRKQYSGYVSQLVQKDFITSPTSSKEDGTDASYQGMFTTRPKTAELFPEMYISQSSADYVIQRGY